jgi:ATP-binding cassette, subfamily C (CFTR/MRP), member 1
MGLSCVRLITLIFSRGNLDKDLTEDRLTFSWMTPMMKLGRRVFLKESDLWGLRNVDRTSTCASKFDFEWTRQQLKPTPSLTLAILRAYGATYMVGGLFKVCSDMLMFLQPQLLRKLLNFVNTFDKDESSIIEGFTIAASMFLVSVGQTSMLHQYFQRSFEFGMRTKSGVTAAIYRKSVALSNDGRQSKSTGDIVNLMSVDTQRLQDVAQYGQIVWSAPFQIILCLASLYNLVGLSMMAGIGIMIIMIPVNGLISKIMKNYQRQQMKVFIHSFKIINLIKLE